MLTPLAVTTTIPTIQVTLGIPDIRVTQGTPTPIRALPRIQAGHIRSHQAIAILHTPHVLTIIASKIAVVDTFRATTTLGDGPNSIDAATQIEEVGRITDSANLKHKKE